MRVHVNIPQLAESAFRMRQCEEAFQSTKQKMMEAVNAVLKTDLPEYQEFHEMTQTSGCEKFEAAGTGLRDLGTSIHGHP